MYIPNQNASRSFQLHFSKVAASPVMWKLEKGKHAYGGITSTFLLDAAVPMYRAQRCNALTMPSLEAFSTGNKWKRIGHPSEETLQSLSTK